MAEKFKNRLKDYRTARNLTQADVAVMAQVSRKTINTIENEIFIPSTALALRLARVLETKVEELFYLEDA